MATLLPHPPIYKPVDTPQESAPIFHLFTSLPPELRIKIWHMSLQRQRIIKVELHPGFVSKLFLKRQGDECPDAHAQLAYGAFVDGYQTISKLFRVNRESRDVASGFYRVHMPAFLHRGRSKSNHLSPETLYFNPEHDFMWISHTMGRVENLWHDFKTVFDHRGVGLLNVVMDRNALMAKDGPGCLDHSTLDPPVKKSFDETLAQLQQVFFPHVNRCSRTVFGLRHDAPTNDNRLNLSAPVATAALNFSQPRRDPRPIGDDLSKIYQTGDPRDAIQAWRRLTRKCLGNRVPETELRVLWAAQPLGSPIYDRREGEAFLQKERKVWMKEAQVERKPEEILREAEATIQTAFGFWLFPVGAFGRLPEDPNERCRTENKVWLDLTENWPELALLDVP